MYQNSCISTLVTGYVRLHVEWERVRCWSKSRYEDCS